MQWIFLRPESDENHALLSSATPLSLQAGDLVLFHSGLFHAAGRNTSTAIKLSLAFAYHGISNGPLPGSRSAVAGSVLLP